MVPQLFARKLGNTEADMQRYASLQTYRRHSTTSTGSYYASRQHWARDYVEGCPEMAMVSHHCRLSDRMVVPLYFSKAGAVGSRLQGRTSGITSLAQGSDLSAQHRSVSLSYSTDTGFPIFPQQGRP